MKANVLVTVLVVVSACGGGAGSGGGDGGAGDGGNGDSGTSVFDGGWAPLGAGWELAQLPTVDGGVGFVDRVHGASANDVWVTGERNPGLHWNGSAWDVVPRLAGFPSARSVFARAANDVWVCGYGGSGAMHFDGAWTAHALPGTCSAIAGIAANDAWALGVNLASRWNGSVWVSTQQGLSSPNFYGAWASGPAEAWGVGESGLAARWDGSTWSTVSAADGGATAALYGVWGSGPNDVWLVGADATVLHWNGQALSPVSLTVTPGTLRGIHGSSGTNVWAIGTNGLMRWNGSAWTLVPWPTGRSCPGECSVWADGAGVVWAVNGGAVFRYRP